MGLTQYFYNFLQLLKIGEDNNGNLTYGGNALPVNAGGVTIFKQSTPPTDVPLGTIWLDDSGTVRFNPTIAAIAPQAFLYTAGLTVAVNISDVQDVNECY